MRNVLMTLAKHLEDDETHAVRFMFEKLIVGFYSVITRWGGGE